MGKHAHPVERPWFWLHNDGSWPTPAWTWKGLDWPAVRRGRQVYTEVFAPCHSLREMNFLQFQQFMTKEEIKKLASNYELEAYEILEGHGPSAYQEDGSPDIRPGKITDDLPVPYANNNAAKFANNGAEPPDLGQHIGAVEGGPDYIFALLTGYNWGNGEIGLDIPPFAPKVGAGQFWNPYFPGCVIGMPPPLSDGILEYDDGTPATQCQMAKDVVNFLQWTSEPMYDDKRVYWWKIQASFAVFLTFAVIQAQRYGNIVHYRRQTMRWWKKPF